MTPETGDFLNIIWDHKTWRENKEMAQELEGKN